MNILNRLSVIKENQKSDTIFKAPKMQMDTRDFGIGAQILANLNVQKMRVMGQPSSFTSLTGFGLEITSFETLDKT